MGFVSYSNIVSLLTDLGNKLRKKPTAVRLTQAEYDALSSAEKHDITKVYYITDGESSGSLIDDTIITSNKTWSSDKVSTEIARTAYTLPTATDTILGGVKIGDYLKITDGSLALNIKINFPECVNQSAKTIPAGTSAWTFFKTPYWEGFENIYIIDAAPYGNSGINEDLIVLPYNYTANNGYVEISAKLFNPTSSSITITSASICHFRIIYLSASES